MTDQAKAQPLEDKAIHHLTEKLERILAAFPSRAEQDAANYVLSRLLGNLHQLREIDKQPIITTDDLGFLWAVCSGCDDIVALVTTIRAKYQHACDEAERLPRIRSIK